MNKKLVPIIIVTSIVGIIIGYVISNGKDNSNQSIEKVLPVGMHQMSDGSMMHNSDNGMGHMMAMMVTSEKSFIEEMIPHHQEAVDTAKEVIERGATTPELKKLVENIVIAQEKEIAEMKKWYESWYGEPYGDQGGYIPMMRELANLSGISLDSVFLEDMIMHHMGAIMMAQSVQPYIEHDEIAALTQAIVSTQSSEIVEMRKMLQENY